jgi:hypothetical protein
MYSISQRSYDRANELGVRIFPSQIKGKKIDVYTKEGQYIASIGALGFKDYNSYIKTDGIQYANNRRHLYKLRHNRDRHIVGSPGFWADQILWT